MEKKQIAFVAGQSFLGELLGSYGLANILYICQAKTVPIEWTELETQIREVLEKNNHDKQSFFCGLSFEMENWLKEESPKPKVI